MTRRSNAPFPLLTFLVGIPLILGLRSDFQLGDAWAAPPPPPSIEFVRFDGLLPVEKPAVPMPPTTPRPKPDCVARAYAKLADDTPALAVTHGKDSPAFWAAYKTHKEALVSDAALGAAGCKTD